MNLRLLKAIIVANWQEETAHFGNKLAGIFTPLMYICSFLLFISVLFQNVDSLAGYSKDEILFLLFMGQLSFYSYTFWAGRSAEMVEYMVNKGTFDYILIRPVSSLFYSTVHQTKPFSGLLNFIGPLTPSWVIINWSNLDLNFSALPFVIICFLSGVMLFHCVQFILTCAVFWTGRSKQLNLIVYAASSQTIPLEGFGKLGKLIFLFIIPVYTSSVTGSVMLGKSNALFWATTMLCIAVFFIILKKLVWLKALRQYSSASS